MKTELTLSGVVSDIETTRSGKWVAFILPSKARAKFSTKVILRGKLAKEALEEVSKGSRIVASGDLFKVEGDSLKLFADICMLAEVDNIRRS